MKIPQSDVALLMIWDLCDRQGSSEANRRAIAAAALTAAQQAAEDLQQSKKPKEKPQHGC